MGYKTYKAKKFEKKTEKAKADEEATAQEEEEAPGPLAFHVNKIMHSVFSNVEMYIYNHQFYDSNGLYAYKSYISNNFKGAIYEHTSIATGTILKNFLTNFWNGLRLNIFSQGE